MVYGNSAKLFCLRRLETIQGPMTLLDMGCGDGSPFAEFLSTHRNIRYIGVDPSRSAIERGRKLLAGLNAELHHGHAELFSAQADLIVSFSVFEHVVRRREYMQAVARNLKPEGTAYINYDAGHFLTPSTTSPLRTALRAARQGLAQAIKNPLVRLGLPLYYERFVRESDFARDCSSAGLRIIESYSFNTALKSVSKAVRTGREDFTERWLEIEMWLNEHCEPYADDLAPLFWSRCHVLAHNTIG
jgi:SAM-dependent methyltransferase